MKSNGWTDGTAALRLFAHLDGEALNVALLMPEEKWAKWEGLSQGLSDYYNSPGRLESAIRRPGMDPATFATELGVLAVRGFGDVGKRARDSMIRDRFIAAQQNCVDISMGFLRILYSGHCGSLPSVGESFGTGAEQIHIFAGVTFINTHIAPQ